MSCHWDMRLMSIPFFPIASSIPFFPIASHRLLNIFFFSYDAMQIIAREKKEPRRMGPAPSKAPLRRSYDDAPGRPCRVDLRLKCTPPPPVENQGSAVSCVAHAFGYVVYCRHVLSLVRHNRHPESYPEVHAAFLAALGESHDRDRGVSFASVARHLSRSFPSELQTCRFKAVSNDVAEIQRTLIGGHPIIAGYQVDAAIDEFHKNQAVCERLGYILPTFKSGSRAISAHAVVIVGYDAPLRCFIARNSWGKQWGVDGHFLIFFPDVRDASFFTDLVYLM